MKELCEKVCGLARNAGQYLVKERRKLDGAVDAKSKGVHDYVTRFDRESEQLIVENLKQWLPESGFIAEEGTATTTNSERYVWIVDPLDGTTNFIHGLYPTCVSIGLQDRLLSEKQGRPVIVLGVVYEIWAQECFYACDGVDGAFLNGKPIQVSQAPSLSHSLLATGFPYTTFTRIVPYMDFLKWTMENCHGVRRLGSAAADLVYTACGRVDGFYEYGLKPYDVAAGAYIVEKAGGMVGDFLGGNNWLFGGEMLASNRFIFDELSQRLVQFGLTNK